MSSQQVPAPAPTGPPRTVLRASGPVVLGQPRGGDLRCKTTKKQQKKQKKQKKQKRPIRARIGRLIGGKSYLVGTQAFHGARRGQSTAVLDPPGPLARLLCEMPELAPHLRVLDLSEAGPGTLSPWQLVPDPSRADCDSPSIRCPWCLSPRSVIADRAICPCEPTSFEWNEIEEPAKAGGSAAPVRAPAYEQRHAQRKA